MEQANEKSSSWQSETFLIWIARKYNFEFAKTGGTATFPNLRHICFNGGVKIFTAKIYSQQESENMHNICLRLLQDNYFNEQYFWSLIQEHLIMLRCALILPVWKLLMRLLPLLAEGATHGCTSDHNIWHRLTCSSFGLRPHFVHTMSTNDTIRRLF